MTTLQEDDFSNHLKFRKLNEQLVGELFQVIVKRQLDYGERSKEVLHYINARMKKKEGAHLGKYYVLQLAMYWHGFP